jgi:hypothetical protein
METMPRATLAPPPAPARAPESTGALPHVPVRAPFTRGTRERGGRITRRGVALSLAAHGLLVLTVALAPVRVRRAAVDVRDATGGRADQVSYVDLGAWPGADGGGGAQSAAPPAGSEHAGAEAVAQPDTASVRTPGAAPSLGRFPQRAPAGIPRANGAAGQGTGVPGGPAGAPGAGAGSGAAGAGAGRSGAAGGRLGTELGDGRLVMPAEAAPERVLTDREKLQARVAARIGAINDSIADEERRAYRRENWTIKDKQGREWGIGKCGAPVIAGVRLPTCTTPPVGRSRESELYDAEVKRQRDEIERQAGSQDRDQNMQARIRATRERMDREREQRRREGASGKP